MRLDRRAFMGLAGAAGVAATFPLAGCARGQTGQLLTSSAPLPEPFTVPLPVPRVLAPVSSDASGDRYRVRSQVADVEILPGTRTQVLGYEGTFPGPTIESRRGRPVVVEHVNELPVPLVVHLHGGVVPADSDGFPTDLVLPEPERAARRRQTASHGHDGVADPDAVVTTGSREYRYPMDQRAATLWYHDHRMDFTGPMVYRGMAGFHLVRDEVEEALPLPRGDRELPLMIADRAFDADGQLRYPAVDASMSGAPGVQDAAMEGVLGDVVLVNGAPWPQVEVDAARYRLRVLNASNARRYRLVLDPPPLSGPGFLQIGSDGGLLGAPVVHDALVVAPAERFDVVVDFGAYPVGTDVVLRNELGDGGTAQVMRFRVARTAPDDTAVPSRLADVERLDPAAARITREFRFLRGDTGSDQGWVINGRPFDPTRMDARVRPGELERWRFWTDVHHPVHVHLADMQVESRGGEPPSPWDGGWKDTVDVRPAEHVDVLVRFPDLPGRYVMHCHNLEHGDMMMMATVEILD